jgi:hypothetical protein
VTAPPCRHHAELAGTARDSSRHFGLGPRHWGVRLILTQLHVVAERGFPFGILISFWIEPVSAYVSFTGMKAAVPTVDTASPAEFLDGDLYDQEASYRRDVGRDFRPRGFCLRVRIRKPGK